MPIVMKKERLNVVIDANWFISACINRHSRRTLYYKILRNKNLKIHYSSELFEEFDGVVKRKKFIKYIALHHVTRFTEIALLLLEKVNISSIPIIVRDSKDNYLLGISESCKADFLVTGDKDLLILETFQTTTILTMGQFLILLDTLNLLD